MSISQQDEEFVRDLFASMEQSIRIQSRGNVDRAWAISSRIGDILAAQSHEHLAKLLGLQVARQFETRIEIRVDGQPHQELVAGELRAELWIGLKESIQSVLDERNLRQELMNRDQLGDDTLPDFDDSPT